MAISDTSLLTLLQAQQYGQSQLYEYAWPQERVTFTTAEFWTGHIQIGQSFTFHSSFIIDSSSGTPVQGFTGTFLAIQVSITGVQGAFRTYAINAVRVG